MRVMAGHIAGLVLLAAASPNVQAQQSEPQVSGHIVRADNGAPIEGASVRLGAGAPNGACCASRPTDSSGYYSFDSVPPGRYIITAFAKGFLAGDYRIEGPPEDRRQTIDATTHLLVDFRLLRPATISGTVVMAGGDPPRAGVPIIPVRMTKRPDGSTRYASAGSNASTDSVGDFTIPNLTPDTYLVCVNCKYASDYATDQPTGGHIASFGDLGFTWYGNTTSVDAATRVPVTEGENLTGLRIVARPMKLHSVVVWPAGPERSPRPPQSYKVHLVPWATVPWATAGAKKQPDGSYRIDNLPPGHYTLVAYAKWDAYPVKPGLGESVGQGEIGFDVADSDVEVHLHVDGLDSVRGVVTWEGTAGAPPPGVSVFLQPMGDELDGRNFDLRAIAADGRFALTNVLPGDYQAALINNNSGVTIGRVRCDGVDVTIATPLRVRDPRQVPDCEVDLTAVGAAPTERIAVLSGPPDVTLDLAENEARQVMDAHFTVRNLGGTLLLLDWKHCVLHETLTNSAGTVITETTACRWQTTPGATRPDTVLQPGAVAIADEEFFGLPFSVPHLQVCRAGTWTFDLTLDSPLGPVQFAGIPFHITRTDCSDSRPIAAPGAARIVWGASSLYGVRLGALLQDANATTAAGRSSSIGSSAQPHVRAGDRVVATMFVDNVSDSAMAFRVGPGAFRVSVARLGSPFDSSEMTPTGAPSVGESRTVMVAPHTQMPLGEETLSDRYRFTPGDYAVDIGFLTLTGAAMAANVSSSGAMSDKGNIVHFLLTATSRAPAGDASPVANQGVYLRLPTDLRPQALSGPREDPIDLTFSHDHHDLVRRAAEPGEGADAAVQRVMTISEAGDAGHRIGARAHQRAMRSCPGLQVHNARTEAREGRSARQLHALDHQARATDDIVDVPSSDDN